MSSLLEWKEKIQKFYANQSIYVDKMIQFLLAFVTFYLINSNIGLMKTAATPVVTAALAIICTFLPPVVTALAGAALVLVHLYTLSLGVMAAAAMIFVMMFIFYCRFTPKRALILLLVPVAFMLKIPYAIPIACGLAMTPVTAVPIVFGTIVYFMIVCVKNSAAAITGAEGMAGQVSLFIKTVFQNKEMWVTAVAFIICVLVVYFIHRLSVDHAWKIAIASGAVVNIVVIVIGDIVFNIHTSYPMLVVGNVAAVIIGLILEFFVFSVDYSRTEQLQYEDDEYYYYVKAVPKISIAAPEKTIKRINERRRSEESEDEEIRRRPQRKSNVRGNVRRTTGSGESRRTPAPTPKKRTLMPDNTDELLLAKSLKEELDIQNIVNKELEDK